MDFIFEKAKEISKRRVHSKAIKKLLPKFALNCFKNTHFCVYSHPNLIPLKIHFKNPSISKQSNQTKCYGFEKVFDVIFL